MSSEVVRSTLEGTRHQENESGEREEKRHDDSRRTTAGLLSRLRYMEAGATFRPKPERGSSCHGPVNLFLVVMICVRVNLGPRPIDQGVTSC